LSGKVTYAGIPGTRAVEVKVHSEEERGGGLRREGKKGGKNCTHKDSLKLLNSNFHYETVVEALVGQNVMGKDSRGRKKKRLDP